MSDTPAAPGEPPPDGPQSPYAAPPPVAPAPFAPPAGPYAAEPPIVPAPLPPGSPGAIGGAPLPPPPAAPAAAGWAPPTGSPAPGWAPPTAPMAPVAPTAPGWMPPAPPSAAPAATWGAPAAPPTAWGAPAAPPATSGWGTAAPPPLGPSPYVPYGERRTLSYAGFWRRFAASFIDGILIAVVPVVIIAIGIAAVPTTTGTCVDRFTGETTLCAQPDGGPAAGVIIAAVVLGLLLSWLIAIRPVGRTGQSPGRKALAIRVADADSLQPIGAGRAWGRYLVRWVLSLCNLISLVDHLWMLFDPQKQTLHDKAVRSVVVDA